MAKVFLLGNYKGQYIPNSKQLGIVDMNGNYNDFNTVYPDGQAIPSGSLASFSTYGTKVCSMTD